jgi:hypothetical protein
MRRNNLADLVDEVDRIEAISANVFDALPQSRADRKDWVF